LRFVEKSGVLFQLVGHLIDDEAAAGFERVVRLLEQVALFVDLENAKRNSGNNVVAMFPSQALQFVGQRGSVGVENVNAMIIGKLPAEIAREGGIEFEQEQLRIPAHATNDLARMYTFTRTVFGNDTGAGEINFGGDAVNQRLGTGNN